MSNQTQPNQQHQHEKTNEKIPIHQMRHGKIASLKTCKELNDEVLKNPQAQVVSKFLSQEEVGRK